MSPSAAIHKYEGSTFLSSTWSSFFKMVDLSWYRFRTRLEALLDLVRLSKREVDAFMASYKLFEGGSMEGKDEQLIIDYYNVLNKLLAAAGNVEKMYIPPLMDKSYGIVGNQELFERKMMTDLGLLSLPAVDAEVGKKRCCLDIGCGRGRVALHTARAAMGALQVSGMNIEVSQVEEAKSYAKRIGMDKTTDFKVASYNDHPLPYPDEYFDAAYNIQAFTYSKDLTKLFKEIYRILKPGAKFSYLDWCLLDKFDYNNKEHVILLENAMFVLGAVTNPRYSEVEDAMKQAGFVILSSREASCDGPTQAPMINKEREHFAWVRFFARYLLPRRYKDMLTRINDHVEALIEGTEEQIFTTTYQIVCQKKE